MKFDALGDLRRLPMSGTSPVLNDHGLWRGISMIGSVVLHKWLLGSGEFITE